MAANPDKISEPVSQNERAATRVARLIVKEIQERGLRPGAKLTSEHIMIEKYGVARATIRKRCASSSCRASSESKQVRAVDR